MVCNTEANEVSSSNNYKSPTALSFHLAHQALVESGSTDASLEESLLNSSNKSYPEFLSTLNETQHQLLIPTDSSARDQQNNVLQSFLSDIRPFFDKTILLDSPREGHDLFLESLSFLENELVRNGEKFLGGSTPNFVDFGIFPYIDKIGKWMPEFEPCECIRLNAWKDNMRRHPIVLSVMSQLSQTQEENFKQLYIRDLQEKAL